MINAQIVPATAEHIAEIIPRVRLADIEEFAATNGWSAARVLECGLRTSTFCCAGLINGRVVTVFGVAPASMIGGSGIPGLSARMIWSAISAHFCAAAGRWLLQCCPSIRISKIMSMPVTTSQKRGCTGSVLPWKTRRRMVCSDCRFTAFTWRKTDV